MASSQAIKLGKKNGRSVSGRGTTIATRRCGYRMRKLPGRSKAPAMAAVRIVAGVGNQVPSPGT